MKKIIIKNQFDLWSYPNGLTLILFIAISPYLIGNIGSYLAEFFTNEPCNTSNCFWSIMPIFLIYTIRLELYY